MDLGISTNPTPELYTIKVTGEIDISNADSLRNAIDLTMIASSPSPIPNTHTSKARCESSPHRAIRPELVYSFGQV